MKDGSAMEESKRAVGVGERFGLVMRQARKKVRQNIREIRSER
jgi:hypothetical protein